jgi:hypothetical protein
MAERVTLSERSLLAVGGHQAGRSKRRPYGPYHRPRTWDGSRSPRPGGAMLFPLKKP